MSESTAPAEVKKDPKKEPEFKKKQVEAGVKMILQGLGVDLDDENFKDTPARVARAYQELCSGLYQPEQKLSQLFGKKFQSHYKGMIVVGPITATGICPHHLLPVEMTAVLAYISEDKAKAKLGLSKLARTFMLFAARPVMQETVSDELITCFDEYMKPAGCALWIRGSHGCMTARGIKQPDCQAITQDVRGLFETDVGVKTEFEHKLANLGVNHG
jgi:GTP cyclohydrolase I